MLLAPCSEAGPSTPAPLYFGVSEAWAMPFGEIQTSGGRTALVGGIMKAWQEALAAELGRSAVPVILSRLREEQRDPGIHIDVRCFTTPEWVTDAKARYDWPSPYMTIEERLVGASTSPTVQTLEDLHGKSVGTVLGYHYPLLDPLFASARITRDDAPNEAAAVRKQLAGRVDYTVMRTIDLAYLQRIDPNARALRASSLLITRTSVYCARSKSATISLEQLERAQTRLLGRGAFERILADYRVAPEK
ncbi:ABC transporter substrate-binding protein [Niveibacterium umoris]|nr:transporter substrate-binding domain-containing protein [Niveibacterium umoris]